MRPQRGDICIWEWEEPRKGQNQKKCSRRSSNGPWPPRTMALQRARSQCFDPLVYNLKKQKRSHQKKGRYSTSKRSATSASQDLVMKVADFTGNRKEQKVKSKRMEVGIVDLRGEGPSSGRDLIYVGKTSLEKSSSARWGLVCETFTG